MNYIEYALSCLKLGFIFVAFLSGIISLFLICAWANGDLYSDGEIITKICIVVFVVSLIFACICPSFNFFM